MPPPPRGGDVTAPIPTPSPKSKSARTVNITTATQKTEVLSRDLVAADDASMKVKSSTREVLSTSKETNASGVTTSVNSTQVIGSDTPDAAKKPSN